MTKRPIIKTKDNCTVIYVEGDFNQGVSVEKLHEELMTVFQENFTKLSNIAETIALTRADEFLNLFFDKLTTYNPAYIQSFSEPANQIALFETQKEYVKSGNREKGGLLLETLIKKISSKKESLENLVCEQALKIIPSLSIDQINALTFVFLFNGKRNGIVHIDKLKDFIVKELKPFLSPSLSDNSDLHHLSYQGCGRHRGALPMVFSGFWEQKYKSMFLKGFDLQELEEKLGEPGKKEILISCFHNKNKYQLAVDQVELLTQLLNHLGVDKRMHDVYRTFMFKNSMNREEIREFIVSIDDWYDKFFADRRLCLFTGFELSFTGKIIAAINYKRLLKKDMVDDLSKLLI